MANTGSGTHGGHIWGYSACILTQVAQYGLHFCSSGAGIALFVVQGLYFQDMGTHVSFQLCYLSLVTSLCAAYLVVVSPEISVVSEIREQSYWVNKESCT